MITVDNLTEGPRYLDLYQSWRSGKVNRMHTMPQLHRENVAEHTWGFLFILLRYWPDAPKSVIVRAIFHDSGEIATGDVPGHIKWADPVLTKVLEDKEEAYRGTILNPELDLSCSKGWELVLELCDRADFCVSCIHEMRLGNWNSAEYFERSLNRILKTSLEMAEAGFQTDVATKLATDLVNLREEYTSHVS